MPKKNKESIDYGLTESKGTLRTTIPGWDSSKIENAKVLIIGAGALGNEVLKNLALIGVGNLIIVDFDFIERTNLAKSVLFRESDCKGTKLKVDVAFQRIKEINPQVKIKTINGDATIDIGLGLFKEVDVVISCLDNRLTRMWTNRFCFAMGKTWVDGGIMDLEGQVDVYTPGINCYECGLSPKAIKNIRFRNGCLTRIKRYASAGYANTNSIVASIVGALQVQEALKAIADPKNSLAGSQLFFDGRTNYYDKLGKKAPLKSTCKSHELYSDIVEAPQLTNEVSIRETLDWLKKTFDDDGVMIWLHYNVVLKVATGISKKVLNFIKPRPKINDSDLKTIREVEDEEVRFIEKTDRIDYNFPDLSLPLKSIGIPQYHILKIVTKGKKAYVELSGDRGKIIFQ